MLSKLDQLWLKRFDGVVKEQISDDEWNLIADVRAGGASLLRPNADTCLEILRRLEHVLQDSPANAEIPTLNDAAAGNGCGKTVIANRADSGADLYLWSIRTDAGQWMSELGLIVPGYLRKNGLPSKEATIIPATAGKFATRAEAECEAIERGIDWMQERHVACTANARLLIDDLLPLLEQSIKEISSKPDRPVHTLFGEPVGDAGPAAPVVAGDNADNGGLTPDRSPGQTLVIPLSRLATLPANPIPDPGEVSRIASSLQARGQDEPIIVLAYLRCPAEIELPANKDWLVLAGATRLAAAQQIGWTELQAREYSAGMSYAEILTFACRNNLDRRTVNI